MMTLQALAKVRLANCLKNISQHVVNTMIDRRPEFTSRTKPRGHYQELLSFKKRIL